MRPKLRLSRLRDIGWAIWDPIGLLDEGEKWDGKPYADEYDSYLMQAAGQLRRNLPVSEVVYYLIRVEAEHMGLGTYPDQKARAEKVVEAIKSDDQLWTS